MSEKLLLQVKGLSKNYGLKQIFHEAEVSITEKQKIGVIGRNGAGKTTFFKMLMGLEEQDNGEITHMPSLKLGYIPQQDPFSPEETVLEFLQRYTGKPDWECAKVASQFQLKNERLASKIGNLSGGYQMRVKLTATLLFEPNLLLLDEPTNYLDLNTLILLEQFLKGFRGSFMVITHDREFLKKTCTSTLDVEHGKLFLHPEPLEQYLEYKEEQKILAASVNANIEKKQKQLQEFVDRFGAKASKASSAQSKLKQIEKLDNKKISINHAFSTVKMYIPPIDAREGTALECRDLEIGYPGKMVASDITFEVQRGKKVAILGDNGQGKSTLLKTFTGDIKPLGGICSWKSSLKVAYYAQHVNESLDPKDTIVQYCKRVASSEVNDEQIFRVLGNFLFKKSDYLKEVSVLSGGEKARLCLAGMFLTKSDVYLLDEPTNHLDFETVEAMGEALGKFNGTVFVVSHDRTFVNLIASEIMEVGGKQVKRILGSYEDYVWQMEQQAENSGFDSNSSSSSNSNQENKPVASSKENAKRLYELRKDLQKIERKIANLQAAISSGENVEENQAVLANQEIRWIEVSDEIGKLS
jgi:ATP-binding cassette subfamily F protein 3